MSQVPAATAGDTGEEYRFPLSYPQLRMWFVHRLAPGDASYHMPIALVLRGRLDVAALGAALREIVARHEVLRTGFSVEDGEASQAVRVALDAPLVLADLSGLPDPHGRVRTMAAAVVRHPFNLSTPPPLRAVLARIGPDEHALVVAIHHIACDGWSIEVLAAELAELYRARLEGLPPRLPDLPVQYGDFAVWQRNFLSGDALQPLLRHWSAELAGAPVALDLPTDRPRLLVDTNRGAHLRRPAGHDLTARLDALAGTDGVSLFMVLSAGFAAVLARLAGADDVVIGTPTAGRARPEVRHLIGCFIDMLPIRLDLSGDPTPALLLARARSASLSAFAHQDLPFERLVEELRPERDLPRTPVFQVMLTLQEAPVAAVHLPGLSVEQVRLDQAAAKYELSLNVERVGRDLLLDLEYNADLFAAATAARVLDGVMAALGWLSGGDATPLSRAPLPAPPPRGHAGEVDIRGYRTDPADVVAVLTGHPAVREAALAVHDGTLVAYVVRDPAVPAGTLPARLRADLPAYLVPAWVVEVDRIARTGGGEVDAAALPRPRPRPEPVGAPPADAWEAAVLDCFRRVLRRPAFGMPDNFFGNGGSSLMALRLVGELERDLGCHLAVRDLVAAPTPAGAVAALRRTGQDPTPLATPAGPDRDGYLAADIEPAAPGPRVWKPRCVLLTGATGFLGHALLHRLREAGGTRVVCLVRSGDDAAAAARLREAAARYGYLGEFDARVGAVAGDVAAPRLGLTPQRYAELAREVDAVYHCAATVSFATPYDALRAVNVTGTEEVIRFAAAGTGKALHLVSTLGQAASAGQPLYERPYAALEVASSGYATSKRVAEALAAQAGARGLPVTILRPGLVTAHRVTGAMGEHDQLALGLRTALRLGILPDLPELPIHVMPVDQVADAIVALCGRPEADGRVVHVYNNRLARLGTVAALLAGLGHPCRPVPVDEWAETVMRSPLPDSARLLVRLFAEAPDRAEGLIETTAAAALLGRPLTFSELTADYLQRSVAYLLNRAELGGNP